MPREISHRRLQGYAEIDTTWKTVAQFCVFCLFNCRLTMFVTKVDRIVFEATFGRTSGKHLVAGNECPVIFVL